MKPQDRSARTATVAAALAVAAALRFWGIGFGPYHPDEHLVINHALAFGTGDLNPHMFYFPTFLMYLLFGLYGAFYAAGSLAGRFTGTGDFIDFFLREPLFFYVIARSATAVFGVLTVWVVYRAGRAYRGPVCGVLAALFMAVAPLHARDSHFATPDVPMTFFVALSAFLTLRFLEKRRARDFYLACLAAGVGASVKYNALGLALPLLLAAASAPAHATQSGGGGETGWMKKTRLAAAGAAFFAAAFLLLSPYVLLDYPSFIADVRWLKSVNEKFHLAPWHHARFLFHGLGAPLFAAALAGMFAALRRFSPKEAVFASFPAAYYVAITCFGQHFERYTIPLFPFLVVWAGAAFERFAHGRGRLAVPALAAAFALAGTAYTDLLLSRADTRDLARAWIERNAPSGAAVVINNSVLAPRLSPTPEQVREKITGRDAQDPLATPKRLRLERFLALRPYPEPNYTLYYLQEREGAKYSMLGPMVGYNLDSLKNLGVRYLITNHLTLVSQPAFFERVRREGTLAAVFDPRIDKAREVSPFKWTTLPLDFHLWNLKQLGPLLYVFELQPGSF